MSSTRRADAAIEAWPSLPLAEWQDTLSTLHRWTQIVGKVRLATTPWINHSWHVTLYPTARGLTTSPMACGTRIFQIDLDFVAHRLIVTTAAGDERSTELRPRSVADLYAALFAALDDLGLPVEIHPIPNELPDALRLDRDDEHRAYDPEYANRFWRVLLQSARVFRLFRARFVGKCSPVHFFWGSCDLAVTRFSGRTAPPHPGGVPHLPDEVAREAYSHEVSSAGFWPGGGAVTFPAYYSYAYPAPAGFAEAAVQPASAFFHRELGEFVLPYDDVRSAASPDDALLEFLQSTYEAAANLAKWDRAALERPSR